MSEEGPVTESLAARAARDDPESFAALVARVRGRLETWIALRLGPRLRGRVAEDDVLQETLLQAFRTLDGFVDGGPGSFGRWLLSIAENRIRDLHKYHGAQKRDAAREVGRPRTEGEITLLGLLSFGGASPPSVAQARETNRQLAHKIETLPEELRQVVIARALEERSFREIAEQFGTPITTVQARFARGIRALRDVLTT